MVFLCVLSVTFIGVRIAEIWDLVKKARPCSGIGCAFYIIINYCKDGFQSPSTLSIEKSVGSSSWCDQGTRLSGAAPGPVE